MQPRPIFPKSLVHLIIISTPLPLTIEIIVSENVFYQYMITSLHVYQNRVYTSLDSPCPQCLHKCLLLAHAADLVYPLVEEVAVHV